MQKLIFLSIFVLMSACQGDKKMEESQLTTQEEMVIRQKGTERPFTGFYTDFKKEGVYHCRQCDAPLYTSDDKFSSSCGWPSFDDEITGAVKRIPDKDGQRVEILCNHCNAHLGHVFMGEGFTEKSIRHCVNSLSLRFEPTPVATVDTAFFAGGCFWGVEYHFEKLPGVLKAVSGYMGGAAPHPTYKEVCSGTTGHLEVVAVEYDPTRVTYEALAKLFFEIHDPTQTNGQGPDLGSQYRSAIFVKSSAEREIIQKLVGQLEIKSYKVATEIREYAPFYVAEEYHQDYYIRRNKEPYCHSYTPRF